MSLAEQTLDRMSDMENEGRLERRDSNRLRKMLEKARHSDAMSRAINQELDQISRNSMNMGRSVPRVSSGKKSVMEPSECQLPVDDHQQLFIETCFFARLGFVQPPVCLKCTYIESSGDGPSNSESCDRWIIWRKDANKLFHPEQLEGNLILVKCCAARRLLQGHAVDGYRWNEEKRRLEK